MTCNRDCFNCTFPDCVVDDISAEERRSARQLDAVALLDDIKYREGKRSLRYYYAHREERLAYKKAWRESRREEIRDYYKAYYQKHREEIRERQKQYTRRKREEMRCANDL